MLKFFEFDIDEKRLHCATHFQFDKYKRQKLSLKKSPYSEKAYEAIEGQVKRVNKLLKKFNHQQIEYSRDNY